METPTDHDRRRRAFFGRRKGHPLRARQAALFDTLLPRLALDLTKPGARRSCATCSRSAARRCPPRNRFRRRRASDRAGAGESAQRLHRQRRLRQRHRQGARRHRWQRARQYPPAFRRRQRAARLAAGGRAHAHRSALSRSVAEAAALEAALHPGRQPGAAGAHHHAGRRIPLRQRLGKLRRLDAGAPGCARPTFTWTAEAGRMTGASPGTDFTRTRYEAKANREGRAPLFFQKITFAFSTGTQNLAPHNGRSPEKHS